MRSIWLTAIVLVALCTAPAAAARNQVTVLLATSVTGVAPKTMTAPQWKAVVVDYVDANKVIDYKGDGLPTVAQCKAAGAVYALNAVFDVAPKLPGIAYDPDRTYATARFDRVNCITGEVTPTQVVRVSSDPLSQTDAGDYEPNVDLIWNRTIRGQLGHASIALAGVARITQINGTDVLIDAPGMKIFPGMVLRVNADGNGKPRPPVELTVTDMSGKLIAASFNPKEPNPPHVGDFIETAR